MRIKLKNLLQNDIAKEKYLISERTENCVRSEIYILLKHFAESLFCFFAENNKLKRREL